MDFRAVQGAVAADGTGNLLCSLAGTMPIGFRPMGTSMVELTGISSRRIGVAFGAVIVALAVPSHAESPPQVGRSWFITVTWEIAQSQARRRIRVPDPWQKKCCPGGFIE